MGFTKRQLMYEDDRRFRRSVYKDVCAHHITDYAVKRFIIETGSKGICTYCGKKRVVAELDEIVEFIMNGIGVFYEDAANSMRFESAEGGYYGAEIFDINELLFEIIGLEIEHEKLQLDVESMLDLGIAWCERDPYEFRENEMLMYDWGNFKEIVKYRSRYLFHKPRKEIWDIEEKNPYRILEDVANQTISLNLFIKIKPLTRIYRCRQHEESFILQKMDDIAAPPVARLSNRMSPAGISMFYCAFERKTAQKETWDPNVFEEGKTCLTTGALFNKVELQLLDLYTLPNVPSFFDEKLNKNYYSILFLKQFVLDLSKDIDRNDREHIEYIPTQIVTEYFRYVFPEIFSFTLDGIIYPSSKNKGGKACVLFLNYEESINKIGLNKFNRKSF